MRKEEFLKELKDKLKGLPPEDIDDRVGFYSEMIDDRVDEGKSEEEVIEELGGVDSVVNEIAKDTNLMALVKEKVMPKQSLKAWQIVLIALGFPLWFPLVLVAVILCLVAYLLIWVFVIVVYTLELSLLAVSIGGLIVFLASLFSGQPNLIAIASSILSSGAAILLFFGCVAITKATLKLSKKIITSIKAAIIKKGK